MIQNEKLKRGGDFKNCLRSIFEMSNLNKKYIDILLNKENMKIYDQVFTHSSVDEVKNYEVYEMLGDATLNKNIVWYISRKYPFLNVPKGVQIISKLKNSLVSKSRLGKIGLDLQFNDFIKASDEEIQSKRESLMEDVFEALIGATEKILDEQIRFGVGNEICRQIIKAIYDQQYISLKFTDLYDPTTILKETFDMIRKKATHPDHENDRLLYVYNTRKKNIQYNKNRKLGENQLRIVNVEKTIKIVPQNTGANYTGLIIVTLFQTITIIDKYGNEKEIQIKLGTGSGALRKKAGANAAKPSIKLLKEWGIDGIIPQVFYDIPQLSPE